MPGQWPTRIEEAFDYRGDMTVELNNGERVEGYIFDRDSGAPATLRIMARPAGGS